MQSELQLLLLASISIAFLHTLSGPDHYLPFIALENARKWTLSKTLWWTVICGLGHVLSSVLLGLGGAALGWSVSKITHTENLRGGIAGWSLLLFGFIYSLWGIYRSRGHARHKHFDTDSTGDLTVFEHDHKNMNPFAERHKVTPWVMFIIFVLGPCEPMIPLLYFPAAQHSTSGMLLLIGVYSTVTLSTMIAMVLVGHFSLIRFNVGFLEKHMHTLAGLTLCICAAGILFMGW